MEENKKDVLPLEGEPLTAPQISEPVVNALAAALSKIETYVPTQYIDDGPPDIDADHLNHAEQAIMRVTNLANGAADAIAALQSQVTQLNNNLALQTQTLYKNVVIYRIGNIAMLSASSWVRKEELAGLTIPTGYRPVKNISIPFTQQNFNDGAYCDVSAEGKIDYTGTSPIVINAVWFCA